MGVSDIIRPRLRDRVPERAWFRASGWIRVRVWVRVWVNTHTHAPMHPRGHPCTHTAICAARARTAVVRSAFAASGVLGSVIVCVCMRICM